MKSRLKAFALHITGSVTVLVLVLGALYLGWYSWPGWYLTGVTRVLPILVGVDVVVGPLLTLVIANPKKSRRELARDIGCIVVVQLVALSYGVVTLWTARPLFYTYSEGALSVTQGTDLQPDEVALARQSNPDFAPHWYSLPRWAWAPVPHDEHAADIVVSKVMHGCDITCMPRYFKPWQQGLPQLREQLKKVDDLSSFSPNDRKTLKMRLKEKGLDPNAADTLPTNGHGMRLLAVFDLKTLRLEALVRPN